MAKKTKAGKKKQSLPVVPAKFDRVFTSVVSLLQEGDYKGTIAACGGLLSYLPQRSPLHIDVLITLGGAQSMLQNYPEAFAAYSEGLEIDPLNADLLYNNSSNHLYSLLTFIPSSHAALASAASQEDRSR